MKTKTVTVREGELLGPIDWNYDFLQHFQNYSASPEYQRDSCEKCKQLLRLIEQEPMKWKVDLSHSVVARQVLAVGMYDGWPFWKPTPALLTDGTLGSEWHFFYDLRGAKEIAV